MLNALTVDIEDYFQVTAFAGAVKRYEWGQYPLRVEENTRRVLDLFDRYGVKGTFFVLGWVAERIPGIVWEVCRRGHELASHGYGHELVYEIGPERFREDIRRSKKILEDLSGRRIHGYRAPSYSITSRSQWALEILVEEGFTYDSSIFPIVHDIYGIPGAQRFPHMVETPSGSLREFPISTLSMGRGKIKYHLPVAGGGYLRLFPATLVGKAIDYINQREGQPAVVYFHPWEMDPGQPRIEAKLKSRFRHYLNLGRMEEKVEHLLRNIKFGKVAEAINACEISKSRVTEGGKLKIGEVN